MKTGKILLTIFVFVAFTKQGIIAYKQTGELLFSAIIIVIMLLLCTLLLRSAFKPKERLVPISKFRSMSWNFLKVFSVLGILGTFVNGYPRQTFNKHIIELNGLQIPLDRCIDESVELSANIEARKEFCSCLAKKLVDDENIFLSYRTQLQAGQLDIILDDLRAKGKSIKNGTKECFELINTSGWNETMKKSLKKQLVEELKQNNEEVKDIEKYCDCLIEKLEHFPAEDVMSGNFFKSTDWTIIKYDCKYGIEE